MRIRELLRWALVGAMLPLSACETPQHALPPRAAFDLNCPEEYLSIVEIDSHTRGVRGCGQQAVYVQTCSGGGGTVTTTHCSWTLEPGSRASLGPALPPMAQLSSPVPAGSEPPDPMAQPTMSPPVEPVPVQPNAANPVQTPPTPTPVPAPGAPTPTPAPAIPTASVPPASTPTGSFPPTQ